MHIHDPNKLVESLCELPRETGWVEFKENNFDEDSVGQYVSSLANSAMLEQKDVAYLVFGVRDKDHQIVGTTVDLAGETVGAESFIFWLNKYLDPRLTIKFEKADFDGRRVEIMCIDPGYRQPVKFKRVAYIRIGSAQQPLSNHPERERALWQITSRFSFETSFLADHMSLGDLVEAFAYPSLLKLLGRPPSDHKTMVESLISHGFLKGDLQGSFQVSALLAIACARDMRTFPALEHKGIRILVYKGRDKLNAVDDKDSHTGHLGSKPKNFVDFLIAW